MAKETEKTAGPTEKAPAIDVTALDGLLKKDLEALARTHGLKVSGTKAELVERLRAHAEAPVEEAPAEEAAPEPETAALEAPAEGPVEEAPPMDEAAPEPEVEAPPPPPEEPLLPTESLLLFDLFDLTQVTVPDAGLARYINLDPVVIPHTSARHANRPFAKARNNIVERLINNMMRTGRYTGKKMKTYAVVRDAFVRLEKRKKKNPVQVLVEALSNAAPREEVTRLRFGGISVPRSVDMAPSRRLDVALRNICVGAVNSSHKSKKPIAQCLAEELIAAAEGDISSYSISKKEDMERVAGSAR